jgi:hypothetical protein
MVGPSVVVKLWPLVAHFNAGFGSNFSMIVWYGGALSVVATGVLALAFAFRLFRRKEPLELNTVKHIPQVQIEAWMDSLPVNKKAQYHGETPLVDFENSPPELNSWMEPDISFIPATPLEETPEGTKKLRKGKRKPDYIGETTINDALRRSADGRAIASMYSNGYIKPDGVRCTWQQDGDACICPYHTEQRKKFGTYTTWNYGEQVSHD